MAEFRASARIFKMRKRVHLKVMSRHSLRKDKASQRRLRKGATLGDGLQMSILASTGSDASDFEAMRDVEVAYDQKKVVTGAVEPKHGDLGFHAIVSVSIEWIEETGNLHDPENPRNRQLIREVTRWLNSWCGKGAVYAVRLDLDEAGGATVDAFVMPVFVDGRNGKKTISTSKPLTALRKKHNERKSYVAMQTDWALYCRKRLDKRIERGIRKSERLIDHLTVEEFKEAKTEFGRRIRKTAEHAERLADALNVILDRLDRTVLTAEERQAAQDAHEEAVALQRELGSIIGLR